VFCVKRLEQQKKICCYFEATPIHIHKHYQAFLETQARLYAGTNKNTHEKRQMSLIGNCTEYNDLQVHLRVIRAN
jgi:hypothetical protein